MRFAIKNKHGTFVAQSGGPSSLRGAKLWQYRKLAEQHCRLLPVGHHVVEIELLEKV